MLNDNEYLEKCRDRVREDYDERRKHLEEIAKTEEQDQIMIEGETTAGYYCQLMVDPKDAANIMLDYDYPLYAAMGEDAPDAMWSALGRHYGLRTVSSVDI